ncbi:MAG: hypothetical protein H2065_00285 [Candidatus Poseidoniales archaeon]|nr:hypothetical protein [Candidatus Poseidoniales archaeon]
MMELHRDDEAVSAAIATVLLFGGVISIISLMMVTMIPVIEELEGSVERHDMAAQMTQFNQQTATLSEQGMPGDVVTQEFVPVDGALSWDVMRSGMWYSTTWEEDHSFRIRDALDFDDMLKIRHPESTTSTACFSDLRLGPDRPYHYTAPTWAESVIFTTKPGLSFPLGPIDVDVLRNEEVQETAELFVDDVQQWSFDNADWSLESSQELVVHWLRGGEGTTEARPTDANADGLGRSWALPLPAGTSHINIVAEELLMVHGNGLFGDFTEVALPSELLNVKTKWNKTLELNTAQVVHITTTTNAQLMLSIGDTLGSATWKSLTGSIHGTSFIPPTQDGYVLLSNPNDESATVTWRGSGVTIDEKSSYSVAWPPLELDGASNLQSDLPISVTWTSSSSPIGVFELGAADTGMESGLMFNSNHSNIYNLELRSNGEQSTLNISTLAENETVLNRGESLRIPVNGEALDVDTIKGHGIYALVESGTIGLQESLHDGARRCVSIDITASGWVDVSMPWSSMGGRSIIDLQEAWRSGTYPASLHVELYGLIVEEPYTPIGSAWVMQISRFVYGFESSVTGMEVAMSGGAVVTNHPEFNPTVLAPPADRGGPGPRFAATIPALHPTSDSAVGGGVLSMEVTLTKRTSLASDVAYEVRRGWAEPYGKAIAQSSTDGLEGSEDWTIYPGRLDLLNDYVGWVPDPGFGTVESVWHTAGQPIQFSLQISTLDAHVSEVIA